MVLLVVALGGLGLIVVCVRHGFRWLLYAVGAWLLLFAWILLGVKYPLIGYPMYPPPFALGAWWWTPRQFRRNRRVFEAAMRAEAEEEDRKAIPKITNIEVTDDGLR